MLTAKGLKDDHETRKLVKVQGRILLSACMILFLAGSAHAANITVCSSGCDFSSVRAAIDTASPGDTVEIQSGKYFEDVIVNKDISLKGIDTGGGKPSLGVIQLCGHPESSVTGLSYSILSMGCPPGQAETDESGSGVTPDLGRAGSVSGAEASGSLVYLNDFSTSVPLIGAKDYKKEYSVSYKAGRLYITVQEDNYTAALNLPKGVVFDDFIMEVDASKEAGPDGIDYGLILRQVDDSNYYRFRITADGGFGFDKLQNGVFSEIIPLNRSDAVHAGNADNHIKVECNGSMFEFYVNGSKVGEALDSSFAYGMVGLEVGGHSAGKAVVSFDNMMIWSLPSGSSGPI